MSSACERWTDCPKTGVAKAGKNKDRYPRNDKAPYFVVS
jgi:hypothetical protein